MSMNLKVFPYIVMFIGFLIFGQGCDTRTTERSSDESPEKILEKTPARIEETKSQYIVSTRRVEFTEKANTIFYKELFKNPSKFFRQRLNILGEVLDIEEDENGTIMQLRIGPTAFDSIIVTYPGSVPVYEDDLVRVYGEGVGSYVGQNRMGASMSWPLVSAKYVEKQCKNSDVDPNRGKVLHFNKRPGGGVYTYYE